MDLKISYTWLKEYVKTSKSLKDFASELSLKSQSVDRISEVTKRFNGVITAKIEKLEQHPNADKLRLATVNTGKKILTIVCGAPNIAEGQIAPLALVGAQVIDSKNGESFTITAAKIRGVESQGMLCSPAELGLSDDHNGILLLSNDTPIGIPLEKVATFNDTIFDVEVTSNRPDAMSVIGLAREAAAAVHGVFTFKRPAPSLKVKNKKELRVTVSDKKHCTRYQAVVLSDVSVGPSPLWLQLRLANAGMRSINNVVDITNYILLEYGQPMHVFDYDVLKGQQIVIRTAKKGERITALDGNDYALDDQALVIADLEKPIAIAGVIGGNNSASTHKTTTIVFEAATFDPVSVRKTSRRLNVRTDSSNLFEKGLSNIAPEAAMLRAIELAQKIAGASVSSLVIDAVSVGKNKASIISLKHELIKRYLGLDIPMAQIRKMLQSLGFGVTGSATMRVSIPWWRVGDVQRDYDIIEEIARLYGYSELPSRLPTGQLTGEAPDTSIVREESIKNILSGIGFTEVYNYSMVSSGMMAKAGLDGRKAVRIANPLNVDMEFLRTDLYPQLLQNLSDNQAHSPALRLFELSNVYIARNGKELPAEIMHLSAAMTGNNREHTFLFGKGVLEVLLRRLGVDSFSLSTPDFKSPLWQDGAALNILVNKEFVGRFGLISNNIASAFGLKTNGALFDIELPLLFGAMKGSRVFRPLSSYPAVVRDVAMVVDRELPWATLKEQAAAVDALIKKVEYVSTYYGPSVGDGKKSIAMRLTFRSDERTLRSEEVDTIMSHLSEIFTKKYNATTR